MTRLIAGLLLSLSAQIVSTQMASAQILPAKSIQTNELLYQAINERLSLMKDVAAYKWRSNLPITASARETVVIQRAVLDGLRYGLTTRSSTAFFRAQIEAAKDIQQCWHDRWNTNRETNADPSDARDLNNDIRPELLRLGTFIISLLPDESANADLFKKTIAIECLSSEFKAELFLALGNIKRYPNRLTQIQQSGILRVGTTGDYSPFSWSQPDVEASHSKGTERFTGIDIDLALSLAKSLSAEVHFVQTSWPTLMEDLNAGHYDIAMSGVSITSARQTTANFSNAYHRGGKTPVSRCEDKTLYDNVDGINQPSVRVIVNPGGTNEKFLDKTLTRSSKILHQDNRTIFHEILNGRADVMVTDAIEARLKTAELPGLCETMPGKTLTIQDKGYMMPQDPELTRAVNLWLKNAEDSGELAAHFSKHLP